MTIRFTNTRRDLIAAQWHLFRRNRALRIFLLPVAAFILYSSFTYSGVQDKTTGYKITYALLYLVFTLGIAAVGGMTVAALNVLLFKGKGILGEHVLTISDEGLEESTAYNRSVNRWSAMPPVWATSGYYFIFITENMAHVVPRKRPLVEGDLEPFVAAVRDRISAASTA
jgi:hypothetical protein